MKLEKTHKIINNLPQSEYYNLTSSSENKMMKNPKIIKNLPKSEPGR